MKKFYLSASIICSDFKNLKKEIKLLEKGGVDYIHFDVMDGIFVPRYGLFPELLTTIKELTDIPVDVHMMVENPELYIRSFANVGADIISVHVENTFHILRTLDMIKNEGVKAGVVLNPGTPVESLKYIKDYIDLVMVMGINPGIVGHGLIDSMLDKIEDVRDYANNKKLLIEVDGGVNFISARKMLEKGANMLVCGTSTVFRQDESLDIMVRKLKTYLAGGKQSNEGI